MIKDWKSLWRRPTSWANGILAALFLCAAGAILYSAWCAFTWGRFTLFDYGIYTNFIWNSGRGDLFRVIVDDSYLSTHLSFSLALLGPFYYLWNHPFLLSLLQWLMMVVGAFLLAAALRKSGAPVWAALAVMVFFAGYKYTQAVLLSEFHTVGAYLLLVPWLYYTCVYAKRWAALPLALILGVREDAFLFILPLLLYFAIKDHWKMGYVLAGTAILYGILSITVLYPAINGYGLLARRGGALKGVQIGFFEGEPGARRMQSLLWMLLPYLMFVGRRALPMLLFPAAAAAHCLLSGYPTQQSLGSHYGGPVMVCLAVGAAESIRLAWTSQQPRARRLIPWRLAGVIAVTMVFHAQAGFVALGGRNFEIYSRPMLEGRLALRVARTLPREGILLTENRWAGMCANRPDLLTWKEYDPDRYTVDLLFGRYGALMEENDGFWRREVEAGRYGVRYFDGHFMVLERGYDPAANARTLGHIDQGLRLVAFTFYHGGVGRFDRKGLPVRYWEGDGSRGPINLSFGHYRTLEPGAYEAVLQFRAAPPERKVRDSWGWMSAHYRDASEAIAERELPPKPPPFEAVREERLTFVLDEQAEVEVRITGADAPLWLDRVWIEKDDVFLEAVK